MGAGCSECQTCHESCSRECDRERKCYVDQNEVKISAYDMTSYPQGTKVNRVGARQNSLLAELAAAIPGNSTRSTAAPTSSREPRGGARLKPQSATWADGLFRQTGNLLGRFQLTPKSTSFSGGGQSSRASMTFEQQMSAARGGTAGQTPSGRGLYR
mmetsp:Transcript_22206/g.76178  ORF Transcript_22206/g.76178 Transcript_22206/m.76178 type:complete len:157 (-) Transcript_22206:191-661(-)